MQRKHDSNYDLLYSFYGKSEDEVKNSRMRYAH